jgi:hypothetical protein
MILNVGRSQGSSVSIVTRLQTRWLGFSYQLGQIMDFFLFGTILRPALGPIHLLSGGTEGSYCGVKVARCEDENSPLSNAEVKNAWSYFSISTSCLHGIVFN